MTLEAALNEKFADLPLLQVKPAPITDDDRDFLSDMSYFKCLLNEIVMQAGMGGYCAPWPPKLSYEMAWLESQVADV